jgi:hypothetical protein
MARARKGNIDSMPARTVSLAAFGALTSTVTRLECVPNTSTHCNGSEAPWAPCTTAGTCANPAPECVEFCTMVDQMMADCRPRHGGCG